jgi:hypothetical protein
MREAGYPEEEIARVGRMMSKRELGADPDTQTLEDALCLVFLETELGDLRRKEPEDKMVEILRKTWKKMSPKAREAARALPLAEDERRLVARALEAG